MKDTIYVALTEKEFNDLDDNQINELMSFATANGLIVKIGDNEEEDD